MKPHPGLHSQRGASLFGLVAAAVIVCFLFLMVARVFPAVSEYFTIKRAVSQIMKAGPANAGEIRGAFDKQKEIEYSIVSLSGKDLEVTSQGERLTTRFAYNKEIELVEPVFLLLKFEGGASTGGSTP